VSDSYPPHLLRAPGTRPGAPRRGDPAAAETPAPPAATPPVSPGDRQEPPHLLLVTAGTPARYEPAVSVSARPRNVTELRERARPATPEPWPAGAYVLVGERGRRAHWNGSDWRLDESPGYGETVAVRSEPEQTGGTE
jgi:hypothetical protein